ncbi:hypothetical protein EV361DRAFT_981749 [Lentinula raphanica]|nr:hypothetical protein EV361DRAFT_981749 [Lentinula raphanica]
MSSVKNILFHALPAWGHNKPMAALAVIIARARPDIVITVITTGVIYPKFSKELKSKLTPEEYDLLSPRINVIDVSGPDINPFEPLGEFAPAYAALWKSEPIQCKSSGQTYSALPPPTVAIVDPFAPYAYESIYATSQGKVPILTWVSGPAGAFVQIFGPASVGGHADPSLETEDGLKSARAQILQPPNKDAESILKPSIPSGTAVERSKVPGMPPMYTHELRPQISLLPEGPLVRFGQIYTRVGDGVIVVSNSTYEREPIETAKKWLSGIGKSCYAFAPLTLPNSNQGSDDEQNEITPFLDAMKERFGPKSLIYISFGTFFWPPQQEKLIALIETLLANQIPFIFSHSPPFAASLPAEFFASINDSGIAKEMPWTPQEAILRHDVTGWFITHGGWNSIQEAWEYKVPLIFWPMGADQPINAAFLGLNHKAAFELIEVRSGEDGTKPLLRFEGTNYKPTFTVDAVRAEVTELLKKLKSEEGQLVRSNFEKLGEEIWRSWDEGKQCRVELNEFLDKYCV